ncbi:uncharacterized protein LOC131666284 isoform X1 [Phymastichus coffea]|uniref:uncharacterized protein LOC131666284 isoform X1 n=1 Tax=Phymastichus coffea TaxID=108790 RepID=UPI00273C007C|nr:uncharacterized protein LOC131666284 isoform X1 [Phymastichus coffea]
MPKLTAVVVFLFAAASMANCRLEQPKYSRHMTITMPKSTTKYITMDNRLYTVSINKSNVRVNSSDVNHKPCDMTIESVKDFIRGEMKVDASDKMIYIVGEHNVERVDSKDRTKYTLLIINPHDCTLKPADIPDINVGMKPALPRLLVNSAGVDVYFPSMQSCAPCRIDNQGIKVNDVPPQVTPPVTLTDHRIFLFDMRKVGDNYLYAQNMEGKVTTIRSLDVSMNVIKEKQVDYPVDAMANAKAGITGVCSRARDRFVMDIAAYSEVICEKINSNLDRSVRIRIPIVPHSKPVSRVSYDIDETTDKTIIAFAENQDLRVYIYNPSGQRLKSYDLGKIDERFEKYKHQRMFYTPYSHWNLRGFITGKEYYLVTEQLSCTDEHEIDLHDVRCINI